MEKYKSIYIILFVMIIIGGWMMINWHDTSFVNAGWIYIGLAIAAIMIYNYAPKLLRKHA